MEEVFPMLLVASTTVITYGISRRASLLRAMSLRAAIRGLIDFVGAFAMFFALNIAVGVIVILLIRTVTEVFVPLYGLSSLLLAVLSAAQGFVFHVWWRHE